MADRYLNKMLGEHETILLESRQHWFVFIRTILVESVTILSMIAVITALYLFWAKDLGYHWMIYAYLLLIIPFVLLIYDFFQWYNRKFVITDFRVIQVAGIINKDVIDSALEKVNDVKLTQSFFGRIFNYGTVEIMTASEEGINQIKTLGSPIQFKTTMIDAKERLEHSDRFAQPRGGAVAKAPTDVPSMIQQLDNLRAQGLLTPEEFQAKKAELLRRL